MTQPGNRVRVATLDTRGAGPVQVGSMICADREFPEMPRMVAKVLSPAFLVRSPLVVVALVVWVLGFFVLFLIFLSCILLNQSLCFGCDAGTDNARPLRRCCSTSSFCYYPVFCFGCDDGTNNARPVRRCCSTSSRRARS
jgi:hypothetical protein